MSDIDQTFDRVEHKDELEKPKEMLEESHIVDFDGPDDLENPLNWPPAKKFTAIAIVSLLTFLSPLASTIIAPGTEDAMKDFGSTSTTLGAFVTTVYILGFVCGPLVIAPLSELYGRSIVYQICAILFFIFNIACAVANNLGALIAFRLLTGIVGSCPITIGAGSIADMISREKRGGAMAAYALGPLLGPCIGPIAGAYLTIAKGWRWNFWLLTIVAGVSALFTFLLEESYPYVILERKTKRLRKETGNPNFRSALDTGKTARELFAFSIFRPLKMLFLSPIVFVVSLYASLTYGYLYLCFTTFPRVYQGQYQFSLGESGLSYLGVGIGAILGLFLCAALLDRLSMALTTRNGGEFRPEYRLPTLSIGAILVPVGLFWYGWTAENKLHWILPIIGTAFLGAGMVIVFMASTTYLIDAFTIYAASVTAASTIARSLLGGLLPLAGNSMYDTLGIGWGNSVLGFIAVVFIPAPFLLYAYGARLRESKMLRVEF